VKSRDGEQMREAGAREVVSHSSVDIVASAEHHSLD
jgi:hypothetical protein